MGRKGVQAVDELLKKVDKWSPSTFMAGPPSGPPRSAFLHNLPVEALPVQEGIAGERLDDEPVPPARRGGHRLAHRAGACWR